MSFVFVSNAEDGDIGTYALRADASLEPGPRVAAAKTLGPMAVSPDRRFLVAAARAKPYTAYCYAIDGGRLRPIGTGPLAESLPYICYDATGRWLLGASYSANLVSVNPVNTDGTIGAPVQVIPTARNAHAIIIDRTNRHVFVPHLGTDQVFQFVFDAASGRLSANTPPVLQLKAGTGPRHLITSPDNRFVFLLNELTATVSTLALENGLLREIGSVSALAPESKLVPGSPRPHAQDVSGHIWASDLHITPDGRFLYAAERTSSSIGALRVDDGTLTYLGSTPTEKQPRGFRIDPDGKFLVASGEKSGMLATYAIERHGRLRPLGRYPTGRGSNWVEIVSID
jgi:6-phosphogluconolactonase